jgi:hypothetical protein
MDKVVEAFIYSFVIYVLYRTTVGPIHDAGGRLLLLVSYSVLVAIFWSAASTNDWFGRLFRFCRITHRTSNTSIWNDVFHNLGGYLMVELGDGRLVAGWVRYFSDRNEDSSLFLEDAAWIDRETGAQIQINGAGILIGRECSIRTISFLTARRVSSQETLAK